jgi:hypothetical protein
MMTPNRLFYLLLIVGAWLPAMAMAADRETERQITALLTYVEGSNQLIFIRNGKSYTASEAAQHLRLKWQHAGSRIKSLDDFIELCASRSSLSGRPYLIQFPDGRTIKASQFFISLAATEFTPQP